MPGMHPHAVTHAPASASDADNPQGPPGRPVGASDPNSGRPSTPCGMRKKSMAHHRAAMPVGLLPI